MPPWCGPAAPWPVTWMFAATVKLRRRFQWEIEIGSRAVERTVPGPALAVSGEDEEVPVPVQPDSREDQIVRLYGSTGRASSPPNLDGSL